MAADNNLSKALHGMKEEKKVIGRANKRKACDIKRHYPDTF
jgi:hypothetical protein